MELESCHRFHSYCARFPSEVAEAASLGRTRFFECRSFLPKCVFDSFLHGIPGSRSTRFGCCLTGLHSSISWLIDGGSGTGDAHNQTLGGLLATHLKTAGLMLEVLIPSHAHKDHA